MMVTLIFREGGDILVILREKIFNCLLRRCSAVADVEHIFHSEKVGVWLFVAENDHCDAIGGVD
jgi:hypothetical protein